MLHKVLPVLLMLIALPLAMASQDCHLSISGNIIDRHEQSRLDFANIYIVELQQGTAADAAGHYEFKNLCTGTYTFVIEHVGCTPDTVQLTLTANTEHDFYLEHHEEELAEITAVATKSVHEHTQTTSEIDSKTLSKLEGKDLGSILSTIAGVNQLKTGTTISKPVIHGMYGDRISIISNGVRLETQDWGTDHAPEIDPFASNTIKVVKGAGSLEYGTDAMGGMVLMEPAVLKKKQHLLASLSLVGQTNDRGITASARVEQGFKKQVAYFLQGTFKFAGDQQTPRYNLTNTGQREGNFSAGMGFLKKGWDVNVYYALFRQQLGILRSAHIGNLTDLNNAIARDTPLIVRPFTYALENPQQKITHHLSKLTISKFFHNDQHVVIIYSVQLNNRKEFDIRRGNRSSIPALDMRLLSNNLAASYSRSFSFAKHDSRLQGKSGVNFLAKHNANNPETGIRPLIPDYYQYTLGIYDMETYTIGNFVLEAGARYEFTKFYGYKFDKKNTLLKPVYNFHTYAFTGGASWHNNTDIIQLQTNLSYSSRFPNASELFSEGLHHGIAALEFGNENLRPEKGIKWVNTASMHYQKYLQAELTFYLSSIRDYIYLAPLPDPVLTIRGAFPAFRYYQTNARLLGLDVTLSSDPLNYLSLGFKASIVRGRNTSANDHLIYLPSDRISGSVELHHDFKHVQNVHLALQVSHVFKQLNTPALIPDYKPDPDAYTMLNSEAGFDYIIRQQHRLSFSVTAENMTNTVYRDYLNRFRYYSDETGWNLIFRLKYTFHQD
ncbi:MAG: TonB-dependent receptor [Chitinophagales bacterium]